MGYEYNSPASVAYRKPIILDSDDPNVVTFLDQEKYRSKIGAELIVRDKTNESPIELVDGTYDSTYTNWFNVAAGYGYANSPDGGDDYNVYKVVTDTDGNIYTAGINTLTIPSSETRYIVCKYDKYGNLVWFQNGVYVTGAGAGILDLNIDSSNNVYLLTDAFDIVKFDGNGVFKWNKGYIANEGYSVPNGNIVIDSSGNIYASAYFMDFTPTSTYTPRICVIKINPLDGSTIWSKNVTNSSMLSSASGGTLGVAIALDSAQAPYISWVETGTGSGFYRKLMKLYPDTGNRVWTVTTNVDESASKSLSSMVIDQSTGDIYIQSSGSGTGPTGAVTNRITKFTSTGGTGWQLTYTGYPSGIDLDSSGNIFIVSGVDNSPDRVCIAKTTSSGTVSYQKTLREANVSATVGLITYNATSGIAINKKNGNINIAPSIASSVTSPGSTKSVLVSLPADGSKTGTYTENIYYTAQVIGALFAYSEFGPAAGYSFTYETSSALTITLSSYTSTLANTIATADFSLTTSTPTMSFSLSNPATATEFPNGVIGVV